MTSTVADALRATIPADMPTAPPVADEGTVAVPLVGGGEVLAGPGTEIPAPPPPPAAQPKEPAMQPVQFPTSPPVADAPEPPPVRQQQRTPRPRPERPPRVPIGDRLADARDRWAVAPLKFKAPMTLVVVAALGLGAVKWVVPWAAPDPDVVVIEKTAPPTTATGPATPATIDPVDPLGWAAWPVNLSARAMIGVQSTGELNPMRATDVSQQAQQKIRDDAVSPCQLRVIVPAPGRLDVTVEAKEGAVPLFNCAASTTTTTTVAGG